MQRFLDQSFNHGDKNWEINVGASDVTLTNDSDLRVQREISSSKQKKKHFLFSVSDDALACGPRRGEGGNDYHQSVHNQQIHAQKVRHQFFSFNFLSLTS